MTSSALGLNARSWTISCDEVDGSSIWSFRRIAQRATTLVGAAVTMFAHIEPNKIWRPALMFAISGLGGLRNIYQRTDANWARTKAEPAPEPSETRHKIPAEGSSKNSVVYLTLP